MSLTTRCPACETIFKVVPDQLRVSEGWVRCGQCQEVFDASAQLVELPVGEVDGAPAGLPAGSEVDLSACVERPAVEVEPSEVSFMRTGRGAAFWRQPLLRGALLLAALLLSGGLAVQVIGHERDRIVAVAPGLAPAVQAVCALLQCTVTPLRRIDAVVIDSSSFNKIRGDVYRLSFTLKNTAPIALALPAIELSLTDSQERLILRRVIQPDEFGVNSNQLAGASETSASLALSLRAPGDVERLAGYRILAFYP